MKISISSIPNLVKGSILNSPTRLNKLARQTGWVIREPRKLIPIKFVHGILHAVSSGDASFRLLATAIGLRLDKNQKADFDTISKSALWERINPACVEFFKELLSEAFNTKMLSGNIPALPNIQRIIVQDSAKIGLSKRLVDKFLSNTNQYGDNAGVRLQGSFDLISGAAVRLELTSYKRNDQTAAFDIIPYLEKGDLLIRDLGYLVKQSFNELTAIGAHYLSRVRGDWVLHQTKENGSGRIDLLKHLQTHAPTPGDQVDLDVVAGTGRKNSPFLSCRLVARRVPQNVEEKRLRELNKEQARSKKVFSNHHRKLQGWEIYITSLPRDEVSAVKICEIYPLRWRIEIIFKAFKSYTPLNQLALHESNENHVQILLYGWLCLVVMASQTGAFALARNSGPGKALQPSYLSLLKVIPKVFQLLGTSLLLSSGTSIGNLMGRWMHQCEYHDRYEKRKKRTNMAEMLDKALDFHRLGNE